jgi:hypothetical protein
MGGLMLRRVALTWIAFDAEAGIATSSTSSEVMSVIDTRFFIVTFVL